MCPLPGRFGTSLKELMKSVSAIKQMLKRKKKQTSKQTSQTLPTLVFRWNVVRVFPLPVVGEDYQNRLLAVMMLVALREPDVATVDMDSSRRLSR